MELTIKITITQDTNGNIIIGDIKQEVDTHVIVDADFVLTESHKTYNYVSIGKYSPLQLPLGENIQVMYNEILVTTHTHRSQRNRIDRLKKILDNFTVGERVRIHWDAANKIITFEKV